MKALNPFESTTDNISILKELLNSLRGENNDYNNNTWSFQGATSVTINFDDILKIIDKAQTLHSIDTISIINITKALFIHSCQGKSNVGLYKQVFDCILKTIFYLLDNNINTISRNYLQSYLTFLLMHEAKNGKITKRLTPISYNSFSNGLQISIWYRTLKLYYIEGFLFSMHFGTRVIRSELKTAIDELSNGDLTYQDWKDGGSFNKLTLDYGRYYIEYMIDFFNSHIGHAISLRETIFEARSIIDKSGFNPNDKELNSYYTPILTNFLSGVQPKSLPKSYRKKINDTTLRVLQKNTLESFNRHRTSFALRSIITSNIEIIKLQDELGIDSKNNSELIRLYIRFWFDTYKCSIKCPSNRNKYEIILEELKNTNIDIISLNKTLSIRLGELEKNISYTSINLAFYESIGLKLSASNRTNYSNELIRKVFETGVGTFAALTGWRSSEFSFSLADISFSRNRDILDQTKYPIKINVKSEVPKTNGFTKLNREITDTCYDTLYLLSLLRNCDENSPPISSTMDAKITAISTADIVKRSLVKTWPQFVNNYNPFKEIDKDLGISSSTSTEETLKLLSTYQSHDPNLIEAYKTFKRELPAIELFFNTKNKQQLIFDYSQGKLDKFTTDIFNQNLSLDIINKVLELRNLEEVTSQFTRSVTSNLVSNYRYPTPHSLRHMWAEAVYRRFDGDVGWMIRSTFKHISQDMWLAYIRDKDNLRHHNQVQRKVISSILSNYLLKSGDGYAGNLNTFLRRLFLRTKTTNLKDIENFSSEEIVSVKSNPWGYCLLKRRNLSNAQCYDDGAPQRQNASPHFCIGCSNYLAQESHAEGILLNIANDINTLQAPGIPAQFLTTSKKTVKNALITLKNLNGDKEQIDQIASILNNYS